MVRRSQTRAGHEELHFADLRSTVCRGWAPPEALERLPSLYHSCLAIPEYFHCRHPGEQYNVCLLDEPEAVICYRVRGLTAHVLNRVFDVPPDVAERVCRSVFRAHRTVLRVTMEVKFHPSAMPLPCWVTLQGEDYVIEMPPTAAGYDGLIGKTTRAHLRQYWNGLQRRFGDVRLVDVSGPDFDRGVIDLVVGWNIHRLRQKGETSTYERYPVEVDRLAAELARSGQAKLLILDGRPVAGSLSQRVGDDVWIRACAFDLDFARHHVGMLTLYHTIRSSAGSARRVHLLWGSPTHKLRLGATRVPSWELSIYRSAAARSLAFPEAARLGLRRLWHCRPVASARWHAGNACRQPGTYVAKVTARLRPHGSGWRESAASGAATSGDAPQGGGE